MEGTNVKVVIILGPPGGGKDSQADILVREYGMTAVPSSQIIFKKVKENPDDPVIQEQVARMKIGYLNDATLTGRWIMEYVREELPKGKVLVFSGSPRTVTEGKVEIEELDELVGLQRVVVISLHLDAEAARERILKRRYCRENKHSIPGTPEFRNVVTCPWDGSELYVRDLDDPTVLDKRFQEYQEHTLPTIALLKESGAPFFVVDGAQTIEGVHQDIAAILERRAAPVPAM